MLEPFDGRDDGGVPNELQPLAAAPPLVRDLGIGGVRFSPPSISLPWHRCTVFELSTSHDPMRSSTHLLLRASLRDRLSGEVVSTSQDVCRALPLTLTRWQRVIVVRDRCSLIAPYVRARRMTLHDLRPVLAALFEGDLNQVIGALHALPVCGAPRLQA